MFLHILKLLWLNAYLLAGLVTAQFNYFQCTSNCGNAINSCTQAYSDAGQACGAVCGTFPCDYRNDGCTNPEEQACVKSCQAINGDCQDPYDSCMAGCDDAAQAACLQQCEDGVKSSCTWSQGKCEAIYQLAVAGCAAAQSVGGDAAISPICGSQDHCAEDYYSCTQNGNEGCEASCANGPTQTGRLEKRCLNTKVETIVKTVTRGKKTHLKTVTSTVTCRHPRTTRTNLASSVSSTSTSTSATCTPTQPVCGGAAAGIAVFAKALIADNNPGFHNMLAFARNVTAGCAAYC